MKREEIAESHAFWRIFALGVLMVFALFALGHRLWALQIEESRAFASSQMRQSVRRVLLPATRGRIFDRDGVCLADNRPSYCIALFIEDLRRPGAWSNTVNAVDARLDELSLQLGIPRQIGRAEIERHIYRQLPMPLLAWQDIDEETHARFEELVTPNAGMDIVVQPERVYPEGAVMAHLVGRVGRDKPKAPDGEKAHYDTMGMKGRDGIELTRDATLSGVSGGQLLTVDVSGYRRSVMDNRPTPGSDLKLTISTRLQRACYAALAGRRGAIVAIDPRNGDVLALCSSPSYDVSAMTPRVPADLWQKLLEDPATPLLNRAITGLYPPGSTFKPAVALAALRQGLSPEFLVDCNGVFEIGSLRIRCAARYGHGDNITMRKALEVSCNPYFCELGVKAGVDAITTFAREAGFGTRTGISLPGEAAGLVPDDAWKRRTKGGGWSKGDTANISIGQGFLLATPLQIALYTAMLANGGTLWRPRLCADEAPTIVRKVAIPAKDLAVVHNGMFDVVNAPKGGGRRARVNGVTVAAKTGTAEYGPMRNRRKHAWMIAFAPLHDPEIAVATIIEDGESGGTTAAPVVAATLAEYFGTTPEPLEGLEGLEGLEHLEGLEGQEGLEGPEGPAVEPRGDPAAREEEAAP